MSIFCVRQFLCVFHHYKYILLAADVMPCPRFVYLEGGKDRITRHELIVYAQFVWPTCLVVLMLHMVITLCSISWGACKPQQKVLAGG